MALMKDNRFRIIGELVEVKSHKVIEDRDAVAATLVIKSVVDGLEHLNEVRIYVNQKTKAGKVHSSYGLVLNAENYIGKKIEANGSIRVERYWAEDNLRSAVRYSANFISEPRGEVSDEASFEFGGFIVSQLTEVLDKEGEVTHLKISIAQELYNEGTAQIVDFQLLKDTEPNTIAYIQENYVVGATVQIKGLLRHVVTREVVEQEVAFGAPVAKTYNRTDRKLIIIGGSAPIEDETAAYTQEKGQSLLDNYKAEAVKIQEDAKNKVSTAPAQTSAKKESPSDMLKSVGKAPVGFSL